MPGPPCTPNATPLNAYKSVKTFGSESYERNLGGGPDQKIGLAEANLGVMVGDALSFGRARWLLEFDDDEWE